MGYDRHFTEERGSEDCFGRCVWALGFTASCIDLPGGIRNLAEELLFYVADSCRKLNYLRAKAYALIGLCYWKADRAHDLIVKLSHDLATAYEHAAVHDWKWFENEITYCNAVLPWSMLAAYEISKEKRYREIGIESLGFLLKTTFVGNMFRPVGCKGWYPKEKTMAEFDQQPVEACETMLACLKAYELTGDDVYHSHARHCLMWYTGHNSLNVSLIDPDTGGCMDGLTPQGPNRNEGAESLVSWMIASLMWIACFGREGEIV